MRAADLARTHRERLVRNGFLLPVMKGWYIAGSPDGGAGDSTAWYTSFWGFCADYLRYRLDTDWCLSPEQSLSLHAGNWSVPRQLLVRAPKGRNNVTILPHGTSVLEVRSTMPDLADIVELEGMRVFSLPAALVACSARYFSQSPVDVRTALALVHDVPDVLRRLLAGGHSTVAGRLAGAFRGMGRTLIANDIVEGMRAAGFTVRESDPFGVPALILKASREVSPRCPSHPPHVGDDAGPYFRTLSPRAGTPGRCYRSSETHRGCLHDGRLRLASIEGYRVSPALIEAVRGGAWNPDRNEDHRAQRDAFAALGYWQACQVVRGSVRRVLEGENPGTVAEEDHGAWYREMFAPGVAAGLVQPSELAGYRNAPVYIRRSMHVPLNSEAVRDAMPAFFDLLRDETEPSVRVVLGHFMFVYVHPWSDGNGRVGRFLMNVMLASGGYPWTIIPVERRDAYMAALEDASVRHDIGPFADFLAELVREGLQGRALAGLPR